MKIPAHKIVDADKAPGQIINKEIKTIGDYVAKVQAFDRHPYLKTSTTDLHNKKPLSFMEWATLNPDVVCWTRLDMAEKIWEAAQENK